MARPTAEPRIYFVTSVVDYRRHFFVEPKRAARLGLIIKQACRMKGFVPLAYAILPNHFHLLVLTTSRTLESVREEEKESARPGKRNRSFARMDRGLSKLIQSIKGNFSWQEPHGRFWKPRFHVVSVFDEASLGRVTAYIIYNYSKMNLPVQYGQHPYVYYNHKLYQEIS